MRQALRAPQDLDLTAIDPRGRPVGPHDKKAAAAAMAELGERLGALQEALYAEAAGGGRRAVLLVLQGMDTSGKGGVIEHAAGLVNPQGLHIASFKKPTPEELAHDFLWRIRKQVPAAGMIGVFDRSHYEDVLVVRVNGLVPEQEWRSRYGAIRDFEAELAAAGVTIVKCMLHISPEEQQAAAARPARRPGQALEVQPGRRRRAGALGRLPRRLHRRAARDRHRRRALVRRPVRPQVVPELGGLRAARRDARGAGPAVPGRRRTTWRPSGGGWRPAL